MTAYNFDSVLVPVPYLNQTSKSNLSITTRQKLKVNILSCRVSLALSECRISKHICHQVPTKGLILLFFCLELA